MSEYMYTVAVKPELGKMLSKFKKNDRYRYDIIMKKVKEILINPNRYKNLNAPFNNLKRVHINTVFVLFYSVNEKTQIVTLDSIKHHDYAYKK